MQREYVRIYRHIKCKIILRLYLQILTYSYVDISTDILTFYKLVELDNYGTVKMFFVGPIWNRTDNSTVAVQFNNMLRVVSFNYYCQHAGKYFK